MNRRGFLETTLSTAAAFSLSGLTVFARQAQSQSSLGTLVAEPYQFRLVDGNVLRTWRLRSLESSGPGSLGAGFLAADGEVVELSISNDLPGPIQLGIPGVSFDAPVVDPGTTELLSFEAPAAGTYLLRDEHQGELGLAMGLSAPLVVAPEEGAEELYAGGPSFDRQYTIVLSESDDRLNRAIALGESFDLDRFEPNYFFANGLSYPDTAQDPETRILMGLGERVAIRIVNAGLLAHPMHFHGYHVEVVARDRRPEATVVEKDTVPVGPSECVDVLLTVHQAGVFPLHTHYVPGVTANGVYVNPYGGALILMEAS